VEEVDTGHALRFRNTEKLLSSLGRCFEQALPRERDSIEKRGTNTMNNTTYESDCKQATDAKAQIEAVVSALTESWNRHDMTAYAAQFTEDADFVNVVGMHWRGCREIEAQHAHLRRTIFRNSTLRDLDRSVRLLDRGVALPHVRWEMIGHESLPGWHIPEIRHGVLTAVLVQKGEGWRVTAVQNTDIVPLPINSAGQPWNIQGSETNSNQ
jgi:uncharacterized protein (TIGR02246 family)